MPQFATRLGFLQAPHRPLVSPLPPEDLRPLVSVPHCVYARSSDVVQKCPRLNDLLVDHNASPGEFTRDHPRHPLDGPAVFDYHRDAAVLSVNPESFCLVWNHLLTSSSSCFIFHRSASFNSVLSSLFSGLEQVGHLKKLSIASSNVLFGSPAVPQW